MELRITRRDGSTHVVSFDADDADLVAQYHWYVAPRGRTFYAMANVYVGDRRTTIKMHQVLTETQDVDHADGNGLNNRRSNLRPATRSLQMANQRPRADTQSRFKGVSPIGNRFIARCRGTYLGCFRTEQEAARAYDEQASLLYGIYAHLNFPKELTP